MRIISLITSLFSLFSFNPILGHDFKMCDNNNGLLYINTIDLNPDPPVIGKNLDINIIAVPKYNISDSSGTLVIKFLGIEVFKQALSLCDYTTCPMIAGNFLNVNITQDIPNILPSKTKLDVVLDSKTSKNEEITCVELSIQLDSIYLK